MDSPSRGQARRLEEHQTEALTSEIDTILGSVAGGVVVFDAEGRIVRMNAFARQMLGHDPATQPAITLQAAAAALDARRPDGTPFVFDEFPAVRALRGEDVHNEEMLFRSAGSGGPDLRASVTSAPVRLSDGTITGCVTTLTNTEAYYQAMEQLQDANARLTQREAKLQRAVAELDGILNALPSGLIVYNAEGRIVRMNEPAAEMLGYDEETWKQPVSERATVAVQVFRPDGTQVPREEYTALRALAGEAVHNEDLFIHLPDHPDHDFWALLSACPIKGPGGELAGAVVTMADTGEFHRVRGELTRTNAELEAILASIPDGLIVNDVDGRVTRMNAVAEEMLKYTLEDRALPMRARLPSKMGLLRPDGAPYTFEEYPPVAALQGEVTRSQEMIMRTPDRPDADARVLASAGPIRTADGKMLGAVTILTDISDLHEARSRLEEANAVLRGQAEQLREAAEGLERRIGERTASLQQATQDLAQAQSQLQALSRRLVQMQEEERSYVADQLYNQAAQVLAALKMQLWSLERRQENVAPAAQLAEMKETLDQTIRTLHDLAAQLRPAGLDRLPITTLLHDYVARYVQALGASCRFDAGDTEGLHLPPAVITAVYRSLQEALANIERHAAASEVALTLRRTVDTFVVTLSDNGAGFDPATAVNRGGVGLISMRERIESVGGQLAVSSTPQGTTVVMEVPAA